MLAISPSYLYTQVATNFVSYSFMVCYKVTLEVDVTKIFGFDCVDAEEFMKKPLEFMGDEERGPSLTITSPNYNLGLDYPNNTVCIYDVPECENDLPMYYVQWQSDGFALEDASRHVAMDYLCLDLVELTILQGVSTEELANQTILCDPFQPRRTLCGTQEAFGVTSSGKSLQVNQRSQSEMSFTSLILGWALNRFG